VAGRAALDKSDDDGGHYREREERDEQTAHRPQRMPSV
jgi:hypothetical protein